MISPTPARWRWAYLGSAMLKPAKLLILGSTSIVIHSVKQRLLRNRPGSDAVTSRECLRKRLQRVFIVQTSFIEPLIRNNLHELSDIRGAGEGRDTSNCKDGLKSTVLSKPSRHSKTKIFIYVLCPATSGLLF